MLTACGISDKWSKTTQSPCDWLHGSTLTDDSSLSGVDVPRAPRVSSFSSLRQLNWSVKLDWDSILAADKRTEILWRNCYKTCHKALNEAQENHHTTATHIEGGAEKNGLLVISCRYTCDCNFAKYWQIFEKFLSPSPHLKPVFKVCD